MEAVSDGMASFYGLRNKLYAAHQKAASHEAAFWNRVALVAYTSNTLPVIMQPPIFTLTK